MLATPTDSFVEALARLNRYTEQHNEPRKLKTPPCVAISRQAGSRGAEIARLVGAELSWPVYDQELLTRIGEQRGLPTRLIEQLDERHMSWLEELVTGFCTGSAGREMGYLRSLLGLLGTLSEKGHSVIVGRGSPQAMPTETTLRVRIVATRADRIYNVENSKHLSRAEAERWIDRTDQERATFVKHYFNRDVADPMGYDLMLNSSKLSAASCAHLIAEAVREMEPR